MDGWDRQREKVWRMISNRPYLLQILKKKSDDGCLVFGRRLALGLFLKPCLGFYFELRLRVQAIQHNTANGVSSTTHVAPDSSCGHNYVYSRQMGAQSSCQFLSSSVL
jgi:hypothetical protein